MRAVDRSIHRSEDGNGRGSDRRGQMHRPPIVAHDDPAFLKETGQQQQRRRLNGQTRRSAHPVGHRAAKRELPGIADQQDLKSLLGEVVRGEGEPLGGPLFVNGTASSTRSPAWNDAGHSGGGIHSMAFQVMTGLLLDPFRQLDLCRNGGRARDPERFQQVEVMLRHRTAGEPI